MEEHVYIEPQVFGHNTAGYNRSLNRSNQPPISQKENYKEKKATVKRCFFLCFGLFIGSVVSGIIAFLVVKYSGIVLSHNESSCLWTEWSEWKGCNSLLNSVTEGRVQIYTGHTYCQQKERFETRICQGRTLDIRFDPTTLYSDRYISEDHRILSNRFSDRTPYDPSDKNRFKKYQGAMVNTCVDNLTSIYYEVYFQYVITSTLPDQRIVLELGIGERNKIDNDFYVGGSSVSGWSFYIYYFPSNNKICLMAMHEPLGVNKIIKLLSSNTPGANVNGTFGILIDRERSKFSLFYNDRVLYTFRDVFSNVPLCPVFGLYDPESVEVVLQIVSVGNMTYKF